MNQVSPLHHSNFVMVYMTAADREEAVAIAKTLISKRLVACANMIEGMQALYPWDGEIQEGVETVVIAKTRKAHLPELIKEVKSIHSYKIPCIVSYEMQESNPDYLRWIFEETRR